MLQPSCLCWEQPRRKSIAEYDYKKRIVLEINHVIKTDEHLFREAAVAKTADIQSSRNGWMDVYRLDGSS